MRMETDRAAGDLGIARRNAGVHSYHRDTGKIVQSVDARLISLNVQNLAGRRIVHRLDPAEGLGFFTS